jgi:hypothetical protein
MEMRDVTKISGTYERDVMLEVADGDDTVKLQLGTDDNPLRNDATTMNLAEARRVRNALTLAIMAAEHNVSDFDR